MIKITHFNGDEKFVTKGAFEDIFKPLGYKKAIEEKQSKMDQMSDKDKKSSDIKKDDKYSKKQVIDDDLSDK